MNKEHKTLKPSTQRREAGFTLIELMVVVIILGLLAGFVAPKLMGRPEEARRTKATVQIASFETALKLYKLDHGSYPTTDQGLRALVAGGGSESGGEASSSRGYLEKRTVPKDPWGNDFVYQSPGANHYEYTISSYGPDKASGGQGKNKDINSWEIE
jgi:general secretion pathway protein G